MRICISLKNTPYDFACHFCTPHFSLKVTNGTFMHCILIFGTQIHIIYVPTAYQWCHIQEKHKHRIMKSTDYWFLRPPPVPVSCFPVWRKEIFYDCTLYSYNFKSSVTVWAEASDTPFWLVKRHKVFWGLTASQVPVSPSFSYQMPVSSSFS